MACVRESPASLEPSRPASCFLLPARFSGQWRAFSGNEIGAMLAEWVVRNYGQRRQQQLQPRGQKLAMLSSTVSSRMLRAIAQQEGMHWEETLTGV